MQEITKTISESFVDQVCDRLVKNQRVRRALPRWGRLHIDRQLPFLCIYRLPRERADAGTERLIQGEASYLLAAGHRQLQKGLRLLVYRTAKTLADIFGAFLILEVWAAAEWPEAEASTNGLGKPHFRIYAPEVPELTATVRALEAALTRIKIGKDAAEVEMLRARKTSPPGFPDFLTPTDTVALRSHAIGLEVRPIYRDAVTGQMYPLVLRRLHRLLARALKRAFYEFSISRTSHLPSHFLSLGRRAMVKAVWEVDQQLAQVSDAFDFLLLATPVNADSAWAAFKKNGFDRPPRFSYRPMPIEPALLKRQLYAVPLERIEEPIIAQLFREKLEELDRKIGMLNDRESSRFLFGSLQLFGDVDKPTLDVAGELLRSIPPRSREDSAGGSVDAATFARRAAEEITRYRRANPALSAAVEVRGEIVGLMVSRGKLLVGSTIRVPKSRVEALIQHEVGTHLLTYLNGKAQPFKQLYSGLAGYEELQEGLAVLAEYLVGGLSRPRLRVLAARVVAARCLTERASFVETFRELHRNLGFERRTAFMITMRVYRAGGLTKDATYLKGFLNLIRYLQKGGALEPLFVGKISTAHIPVVQELQWRKVLRPPLLKPGYMADPHLRERVQFLVRATSIEEVFKRRRWHETGIHGERHQDGGTGIHDDTARDGRDQPGP